MSDVESTKRRWPLLLFPVVLPSLVAAVLVFGHDPVDHAASRPLIHRVDDFIGADACRSCHPDHYESWARTYHRTMTQRVTPETVRGVFDGRTLKYEGRSAQVLRRGDRFYFDLPEGDRRREADACGVLFRRSVEQRRRSFLGRRAGAGGSGFLADRSRAQRVIRPADVTKTAAWERPARPRARCRARMRRPTCRST